MAAMHLASRPELFQGLSKTFRPREDGGHVYPPEGKRIQYHVENVLADVATTQARLADVILAKEVADQSAKATVELDGQPFLEDVPILYLLFLERQLLNVRSNLLIRLPILDPAKDWSAGDGGVWVADPVETTKSKKVTEPFVVVPATKEHPAQTAERSVDVIEGTWRNQDFSGEITMDRKQQLLDRIDTLIEEVKKARERANTQEVTNQPVGVKIFDYLLAP